MKRLAKAPKPPVVVPVVVVAVDVHVPLVVPPVEGRVVCIKCHRDHHPSNNLKVEFNTVSKIPEHSIPSIFIFCQSHNINPPSQVF